MSKNVRADPTIGCAAAHHTRLMRTHEHCSQRGAAGPGTGRTSPWWPEVTNLVVQGAWVFKNVRVDGRWAIADRDDRLRSCASHSIDAHARAPLATRCSGLCDGAHLSFVARGHQFGRPRCQLTPGAVGQARQLSCARPSTRAPLRTAAQGVRNRVFGGSKVAEAGFLARRGRDDLRRGGARGGRPIGDLDHFRKLSTHEHWIPDWCADGREGRSTAFLVCLRWQGGFSQRETEKNTPTTTTRGPLHRPRRRAPLGGSMRPCAAPGLTATPPG